MSEIDGGATAFPCHGSMGEVVQQGMTLRQYFTAKALQGFCANPAVFAQSDRCGWSLLNCTEEELAAYCVSLADYALSALEK